MLRQSQHAIYNKKKTYLDYFIPMSQLGNLIAYHWYLYSETRKYCQSTPLNSTAGGFNYELSPTKEFIIVFLQCTWGKQVLEVHLVFATPFVLLMWIFQFGKPHSHFTSADFNGMYAACTIYTLQWHRCEGRSDRCNKLPFARAQSIIAPWLTSVFLLLLPAL